MKRQREKMNIQNTVDKTTSARVHRQAAQAAIGRVLRLDVSSVAQRAEGDERDSLTIDTDSLIDGSDAEMIDDFKNILVVSIAGIFAEMQSRLSSMQLDGTNDEVLDFSGASMDVFDSIWRGVEDVYQISNTLDELFDVPQDEAVRDAQAEAIALVGKHWTKIQSLADHLRRNGTASQAQIDGFITTGGNS